MFDFLKTKLFSYFISGIVLVLLAGVVNYRLEVKKLEQQILIKQKEIKKLKREKENLEVKLQKIKNDLKVILFEDKYQNIKEEIIKKEGKNNEKNITFERDINLTIP